MRCKGRRKTPTPGKSCPIVINRLGVRGMRRSRVHTGTFAGPRHRGVYDRRPVRVPWGPAAQYTNNGQARGGPLSVVSRTL